MALGIKTRMLTPLRSARMGQVFTPPNWVLPPVEAPGGIPGIPITPPLAPGQGRIISATPRGGCPSGSTRYVSRGSNQAGMPRDVCVRNGYY